MDGARDWRTRKRRGELAASACDASNSSSSARDASSIVAIGMQRSELASARDASNLPAIGTRRAFG
jgi:hypothetical protein